MDLTQFLKKIASSFAMFATLFIGIGIFLPPTFEMSRSVEIAASPDLVFRFVDDLTLNPLWDPWVASDRSMTLTMGPVTRGTGASYTWTSEQSAAGQLLIVESAPFDRVQTHIVFTGVGESDTEWTFEPLAGGTRATWTFRDAAGYNLLSRYMYLLAMERMLAPRLEHGLEALKHVVEAGAAELVAYDNAAGAAEGSAAGATEGSGR